MRRALKHVLKRQEQALWFFSATTIIGAAVCGSSVVALATSPLWIPLVAVRTSEPNSVYF